jgi:hypothetical protein
VIVPRVQERLERLLADEAFDRAALQRPVRRDELDHHLALDELQTGPGRDRLQRKQQRRSRRRRIRSLTVVDRERNPLVLDPGLRDYGDGRLCTRHDPSQLGAVLQPVQTDVHDVRRSRSAATFDRRPVTIATVR